MTRSPLHRLSSTGYRFLKRLGFSPSSNLYHRAQRKALNKGIWAETKLALFDEAAAQKQGGNPLFAKRLLDYGFHAPTTYFPLLVPECFLIEPTETESKDTLDTFAEHFAQVLKTDPEALHAAPITTPVRRVDEVYAARNLCLRHPYDE